MAALGLDDEFWPDEPKELRRPAAVFLAHLQYRVAHLGGDTHEIARRIQGDMALGRQQFGESPQVVWR